MYENSPARLVQNGVNAGAHFGITVHIRTSNSRIRNPRRDPAVERLGVSMANKAREILPTPPMLVGSEMHEGLGRCFRHPRLGKTLSGSTSAAALNGVLSVAQSSPPRVQVQQ